MQGLLGSAKGQVTVGIRGGNRVALGKEVVFEVSSTIEGHLVIIDVNAKGEALVIFPNKFVPSSAVDRFAASQAINIPDKATDTTAFKAVEPIGRGKLLALVAPPDFDLERFASIPSLREKGLVPVNAPVSYFMRLVRQIEEALARGRAGGEADDLNGWAYTTVDYEIVR